MAQDPPGAGAGLSLARGRRFLRSRWTRWGLIVVDEEHEHTYKQEEAPRYHARDVAIVRGQMEGATVILGSATPSLESYYNSGRGKYTLLEMNERVDDKKLPVVRVIDLCGRRRARRRASPCSLRN